MFMDSLSMKFERKKLYDEIWDISLTGVSKKYGDDDLIGVLD